MWPINPKQCVKLLKVFNPDSDLVETDPKLPLLPRRTHPQEIADIEYGFQEWGPKIQKFMQWSDPVRAEEFNSFVTNTSEVVSKSILKEAELTMWQRQECNSCMVGNYLASD